MSYCEENGQPSQPTDCMDCGLPEKEIDIVLPREQWLLIHPNDGGVLCANCIVKRAAKLPHVINLTCRITFADDLEGR